jgi:hypothetical protein
MEKPDCFKESSAKMKRFVDVIKKGYWHAYRWT